MTSELAELGFWAARDREWQLHFHLPVAKDHLRELLLTNDRRGDCWTDRIQAEASYSDLDPQEPDSSRKVIVQSQLSSLLNGSFVKTCTSFYLN